MTDAEHRELTFVVAQLRHAYANLMTGRVIDQPQFARGLIAPQIERIEAVLTAATQTGKRE
jgi:hypothetical protein